MNYHNLLNDIMRTGSFMDKNPHTYMQDTRSCKCIKTLSYVTKDCRPMIQGFKSTGILKLKTLCKVYYLMYTQNVM